MPASKLTLLALVVPVFVAAAAVEPASLGGLDWDWLKPKLTPQAYQKAIKIQGLLTHSKALVKHAAINGANTRSFGTVGYNASADYVENLAKKHGYNVYRQSLVYPASDIKSQSFTVEGQSTVYETATFQYSGKTPSAGVTAPLIAIPGLGCTTEDWAGAESKIALVVRGNCSFVEKGVFARKAKVAALVVYNNVVGGSIASRIDTTFEINPPAIGVTQPAGLSLIELLKTGPLNATVKVDLHNEYRTADNIIAQTKYGNQNKVVFVGAHLDSVPAGPGINDDGSGVGSVSELLVQLTKFKKTKNAVRFAWWSAEEVGLIGSHYYVDHLSQSEKDKIVAYVNMDMVASTNYILGIYDADNSGGGNTGLPSPPGSSALEKLFQQHFVENKLNHTAYAFTAGSDYRPFLDAGIPAGGVATGAGGIKTEREAAMFGGKVGVPFDPCYHQACDTIDNLDHKAYVWVAQAVADIVAKLADNAAPIEKEQALVARGFPIERGLPDELTNLGKECNHHDEL